MCEESGVCGGTVTMMFRCGSGVWNVCSSGKRGLEATFFHWPSDTFIYCNLRNVLPLPDSVCVCVCMCVCVWLPAAALGYLLHFHLADARQGDSIGGLLLRLSPTQCTVQVYGPVLKHTHTLRVTHPWTQRNMSHMLSSTNSASMFKR